MSSQKNETQLLIDKITPDQALTVLRKLWKSDPAIKRTIESSINELLTNVNYSEVSEELLSALVMLSVEDVYDNAGSYRDGYHDPGDVAIEMLEGACQEYIDQMMKYYELGMEKEELEYCKGILLALYTFGQTADDEFIDQAPDMMSETFRDILDKWKQRCRNSNYRSVMEKFIKSECDKWK